MRVFLPYFILAFTSTGYAQWSTDPTNPMVLCDAEATQERIESISDGAGGWFVFWSDWRNVDHSEVFGQRLGPDGVALWEPNGKLLVSAPDTTIPFKYGVLMDDGSFTLAYVTSALAGLDAVYVDRFDPNGERIWDHPVQLAAAGNGPLGPIINFRWLTGVRSGPDVVFAWMYEAEFPLGGPYAYERVSLDGSTQFGSPGMGLPDSGVGQMMVHDDANDGLVFQWQTIPFSQPSPLLAMRVDNQGTPLWTQNLTLSQGSNNAQNGFSTASNASGVFYTSWNDGSNHIRMAAFDTTGQLTWTPSPVAICVDPAGQLYTSTLLHEQHLYVAWGDQRPPANDQDLYMQKLDLSGEVLWTTDGIPVVQAPSEDPSPMLCPSLDGSVIATFPTLDPGFVAMRISSEGSLAWPGPVQFSTAEHGPWYSAYKALSDGQGGVVAFWMASEGDLYGARISSDGQLGPTGVPDRYTGNVLHVFPVPASTHVTLMSSLLNGDMVTVDLLDLSGRTVLRSIERSKIGSLELPLPLSIHSGRYEVRVMTTQGILRAGLVIVR